MLTFRRSLRLFFGIAGFLIGLVAAASAYLARMMIAPPRLGEWATPENYGLDYEEVQFPAWDGIRVSGWFIPAERLDGHNPPTVILVHSWQWNRSGYTANGLFANVTGSKKIELLKLAKIFHEQGYHVLTFDLRNHGQSASAHPVTFGQGEAKDLLGSLTYIATRKDVNPNLIGVVGFSIGANAALFAMPQTNLIKAIVAVQPTTPSLFSLRLLNDIFGVFGMPIRLIVEFVYRIFGGPRLIGIDPAFAVSSVQDTPVLYIQGVGDNWGSPEDVSNMANATPSAQEMLFVNSSHRFDGYSYIIENPGPACAFFKQHFS